MQPASLRVRYQVCTTTTLYSRPNQGTHHNRGALSTAGRMGDSAEVLHTILQQLHYSYSLVAALAKEPEPDGSTTKGVKSSRSRSSGTHHTNGSDMPNAECTSDPCVAHSLFWYESVQAAPQLAQQH